jgi:hypothetical protein
MKDISEYKKRFYTLLESTIGDVKPLLSEDVKTFGEGINTYGYTMGNYPTCIGAGVICPGGTNGDWEGSLPKVLEICSLTNITPGSQKRWKKLTASGNISNHWCGLPFQYGVDLPCNLTNGDIEYEKIKEGLLSKGWITESDAKSSNWKPANKNYTTFRYDGFKCQVLWRCDGDHLNHIHVGCKKENPSINKMSEDCTYEDSITVPKLTLPDFKKIWEDKVEKEIKNGFTTKDPTISRPDLIKVIPFEEADLTLEYEYIEYAEIKFVGDGTNGVSIIALGKRKIDEQNPSMFFIDVYKSDKNSMSVGERKRFGDLETQGIDTLETAAVDAKNYFFDLCKQFEEYPYSKEGPKEFENQNSFDI